MGLTLGFPLQVPQSMLNTVKINDVRLEGLHRRAVECREWTPIVIAESVLEGAGNLAILTTDDLLSHQVPLVFPFEIRQEGFSHEVVPTFMVLFREVPRHYIALLNQLGQTIGVQLGDELANTVRGNRHTTIIFTG